MERPLQVHEVSTAVEPIEVKGTGSNTPQLLKDCDAGIEEEKMKMQAIEGEWREDEEEGAKVCR